MKPPSDTIKVFLVLIGLFLLLATAIGLHYMPGIPAKPLLTIVIAGTKTFLVIWFYMRANEARGVTPFFMAAGFVWLALLFTLTSADYLTR